MSAPERTRKRKRKVHQHRSQEPSGGQRQGKKPRLDGHEGEEVGAASAAATSVQLEETRTGIENGVVQNEPRTTTSGTAEEVMVKKKRRRRKPTDSAQKGDNRRPDTQREKFGTGAGEVLQHNDQRRHRSRKKVSNRNGMAAIPSNSYNKQEEGKDGAQVASVTKPPDRTDYIFNQVKRPSKKERQKAKVRADLGARNNQHGHDTIPQAADIYRVKEVINDQDDNQMVARRGVESSNTTWIVSQPVGGSIIKAAPLFTPDEKHLIVATEFAAQLYSTSNSLLEHSFPSGSEGPISCFSLSAANPKTLYTATTFGRVSAWDIRDGNELERWDLDRQIFIMTCLDVPGLTGDTILAVEKVKTRWMITARRFQNTNKPSQLEVVTLLKCDKPVHLFKIVEQGTTIVATTATSLIVGKLESCPETALETLSYTWREIVCKEPPTCLSVSSASSSTNSPTMQLDLVVGGLKGCIYLYQDVISMLGFENNPAGRLTLPALSVHAAEMHWHREAVGALAWSKDGNYIISGGMETVMVLWQLETGKHQFLPHLEAPIRDIVVSPSGTSYAVRLGDNSVMILSTSELTPTANIAGLQSFAMQDAYSPRSVLPTVELMSSYLDGTELISVPSVLHPQKPAQMLLIVPSYQSEAEGAQAMAAPYLQTFDAANSRHMARQALTRTNATNANLGPEGNRIAEPNIKLMQISRNGRWLITVGEWSSPAQDFADLVIDKADLEDEIKKHTEVILRFWSWNEKAEVWALNTERLSPHTLENSHYLGRILDLAVNPVSTEVGTIGEDSVVRIWSPKMRRFKQDLIRKDFSAAEKEKLNESSETWWGLKHAIELETAMSSASLHTLQPHRAKLAYANDGSCLVAYQNFANVRKHSGSPLYFIDTFSGNIAYRRADLDDHDRDGIHCIALLERYLICVSRQAAVVWDVTTFQQHAYISLDPKTSSKPPIHHYPPPFLAVNLPTSTFCIATSEPTSPISAHLNSYRTRLHIFSLIPPSTPLPDNNTAPHDPSVPIYEATLPHATLSLMSAGGLQGEDQTKNWNEPITGERGYLVLDCAATLRYVRPAGMSRWHVATNAEGEAVDAETAEDRSPSPRPLISPPLADERDDAEDDGEGEGEGEDDTAAEKTVLPPVDWPVVRSEQLAAVLDYPPSAMPPMREIFDAVMNLYAPKPRPGEPVERGGTVVRRARADAEEDEDEE